MKSQAVTNALGIRDRKKMGVALFVCVSQTEKNLRELCIVNKVCSVNKNAHTILKNVFGNDFSHTPINNTQIFFSHIYIFIH